MFDPATSQDSPSVISSQESEAGLLHCVRPESRIASLCGPAHAHANLSARQAKAEGWMTSGTYGRRSSTSSSSAALQSSLASKLRVLTDSAGSTLYTLTWKERATPSGLRICALRASGHRTSASGSTGWPTAAAARDWKDGHEQDVPINALLGRTVWLTGWPTPVVNDETGSTHAYGKDKQIMLKLSGAARLTDPQDQWPHNSMANLTGWPTPNSTIVDAKPRPPITSGRKPTDPQISTADVAVHLTGWPTPCTQDGPNGGPAQGNDRLPGAAGSTAATASTGQLNPAFSLWLMGYPSGWQQAAPGWLDWQAWQGLMAQASSEQNNTDLLY